MSDFPLAGRKTIAEPALRIKSPAFKTSYMEIRNIDLIPAGSRAVLEAEWKEFFEEREIEVFRLRGAYFCEEGLVFDDQLQVVTNASDEYTDAEIDAALTRIRTLLEQRKLPHLRGPGIVSKRRAVNNYGHFLIECLPMAVISRMVAPEPEATFLLQRLPAPMLDVHLRAFRLLGIRPDQLLFLDYLEPFHFEDLVVVRGLTQHGKYMSPICLGAVSQLAKNVMPGTHKKLFVTRVPGWRGSRALVNESELGERLARVGFHEIEPGSLTLEEQIAAFSGADHIVGVAGAAMTNIAFCRPGTQVVSVASPYFQDTFFWFIAMHKGLRYSELRNEPMNDGTYDFFADFRISETDIAWLAGEQHLSAPAEILAHVQETGDVTGRIGEWVGIPGSGRFIEGVQIDLPGLEYRAVLGSNWVSPWVTAGKFCGTRELTLPIYGLVFRRTDDSNPDHGFTCNATFVDGTRVEKVPAGQPCTAPGLAALEAFQIVLGAPGLCPRRGAG